MSAARCLLAAAVAGAVAAPAVATAEDDARRGWTVGGALGAGNMALDADDVAVTPDGDNVGALLYSLHFGGMLSPNLALLVELWGGNHGCTSCAGDDDLTFSNLGVAARYWWLERVWLQGGLASARVGRVINGDRAWLRAGVAVFGAVAYELLHEPRYAIDTELRLTFAGYKDSDSGSSSAALMFGLSWY